MVPMTMRENIRPGGRSARVQASVHKAVRGLLSTMNRNDVTIPLIATEAGVTPSTIYRRWGDLQELLADVAIERLRPDALPKDTGSARTDLMQWAEQYADEMASGPGRAMIRDVLSSVATDSRNAGKCCGYTREQVQVIADRARDRGEVFPDVETVIDTVVAPIMYRILFDDVPPTAEKVLALVEHMLPHRRKRLSETVS
jgi:AcrR family transcriptional regulator